MSTGVKAPATSKPVPPPSNAAAPGTEQPKAKKEKKPKVKRESHPSITAESKLEVAPADFDPKVHAPLTRKDFKDDAFYLEYRATEFEKKANELRAQAKKSRELGSMTSNAKAKKLVAMQARMAELMEQLKAEGFDINSIK